MAVVNDIGDKLSLVSLLLAISFHQCCCYQQKSNCRCHRINENPRQGLITSVSNTDDYFIAGSENTVDNTKL